MKVLTMLKYICQQEKISGLKTNQLESLVSCCEEQVANKMHKNLQKGGIRN